MGNAQSREERGGHSSLRSNPSDSFPELGHPQSPTGKVQPLGSGEKGELRGAQKPDQGLGLQPGDRGFGGLEDGT